jgi:excisionase family DNA binding protein
MVSENQNPVMKTEEAAEYLQITVGHLARLCREKKIPHQKLGRLLRFSRTALDSWLGNALDLRFERRK